MPINFISSPLPYQAVHQIRGEALGHAEAPDSDLDHLLVLEVGIHLAYQVVGCGSSEENQLVEGRTCRPGDWVEGCRLAEREGMACRDHQEEEGHLACRTVEEAYLYKSDQ